MWLRTKRDETEPGARGCLRPWRWCAFGVALISAIGFSCREAGAAPASGSEAVQRQDAGAGGPADEERAAEPGDRQGVDTLLAQSEAEWRAWRDEQIALLLRPVEDGRGNAYVDVKAAARVARAIQIDIVGCEDRRPDLFAEGTAMHAMFRNLLRFTAAYMWDSVEGHQGGLTMPDQEYEEYAGEAIAFPPLLRSQEFLRALGDPGTYRDAHAMIEARNRARPPHEEPWTVLLFRSRFIKTSDDKSYGRFLVFVPGETDKWIQFGIITPEMDQDEWIHSVSMVSVKKTGREIPAAESFIIDYWRDRDEETGDIRLQTRLDAIHDAGNCYVCHKTPVIPIHPLEEYRFDAAGRLVVRTEAEGAGRVPAQLNARIKPYGPAYFGNLMDVEGYGPSVGPAGRARGREFFEPIAKEFGLTEESVARVRGQMKCTECHDGRTISLLNFPMGIPGSNDLADLVHPETGESVPLVKVQVEEGWMPPDNDLTPPERRALYRALMQEYFDPRTGEGLFVDWLRSEGRMSAE